METRVITRDEVEVFFLEILRTFGDDADAADAKAWANRFVELAPLARTYAAFDCGEMVGTSAAFEFDVTVPGGCLPMSGLTMVTVRPTHRRQGVLRSMMAAYLDDLRGHGEPLGGLWASETSIYGRFGFGVAAESHKMEVDAANLSFSWTGQLDRISMVDDADALERLPGFYDRVRKQRPGMLSRSDAWWRHRRFLDQASRRGGASSKRRCIALRGGEVTGYVEYRQRPKFANGLPRGTVEVVELVGIDPVATATLWRFATNIDLCPRVKWWNAPVDCALPWMTGSRRQILRQPTDSLWLRVCDVSRALAGRHYELDGRLRLAVVEPGGSLATTVELTVDHGVGSCAATEEEPDVTLDRGTLGSLFLGGVSASVLGRAGAIRGTDSAILTTDRLFRWHRAPWCPEVF